MARSDEFDPMSLLGPGITAGTQLLGGTLDQAVFQPKQQGRQDTKEAQQRNRQARHAAQLEPFVEQLMNFDTSGLRAQASNTLGQGSNALNAQLSQRGIFDSGIAMGQHREMTGDVLGQLAQDIESSRRARTMGAANIVGNAPGFGQEIEQIESGK